MFKTTGFTWAHNLRTYQINKVFVSHSQKGSFICQTISKVEIGSVFLSLKLDGHSSVQFFTFT